MEKSNSKRGGVDSRQGTSKSIAVLMAWQLSLYLNSDVPVRPPPVSSFSQHYPGNDVRYQKCMSDVRYSLRESVIRSIESGRPALQRKLPKSESLHDCMARTIPYLEQQILPQALDQGKRVLVSSSENAIRGLLMHLCEIPEDHITELEIPNGLPLIFDVKSKCVKVCNHLES